MKNFRSLCAMFSALATFAFVTPVLSQNVPYSAQTVNSEESKKESQQLTPIECVKNVYRAVIQSFKTGKDLRSSLEEDLGVSVETIVKGHGLNLENGFQQIEDEFNMPLDGKNRYLVKKVAYPAKFLEAFVRVIDDKRKDDFEIIVLSAHNPKDIDYRSCSPGFVFHLIRADSKEEAIQRAKNPNYKPIFGAVSVTTPRDLKKFDQIFTNVIENPSQSNIDRLLELYW